MGKTAVVALGGNAITRGGQAGTHAEQAENARGMADAVRRMRAAGWTVVLVHGNGPQVGNLAVQQLAGAAEVPEQPLFVLGAMTEGQLGSLLTLALAGVAEPVCVVTHVVVDPADPAFSRPTKPIGPFLSEAEATRQARERGWTVGEDAGRGYRRMVASPAPLRINCSGPLMRLKSMRMRRRLPRTTQPPARSIRSCSASRYSCSPFSSATTWCGR